MTKFRLADMDVRWSGVDDTTPDGHCLATGLDQFGSVRVWLFRGDKPSDDALVGSLLIRSDDTRGQCVTAYGWSGGYVRSGHNQADLLATLATDR